MTSLAIRSRKLHAFAVACAIAVGAFWALSLNGPATTVAFDGSAAMFSPSDLKVPADLPTLAGADAI